VLVKLLGALYLVWLGIQAIRHRKSLAAAFAMVTEPREGWRALRDGMVVGMTNPKSYILFGAILPQFVNRGAGDVPGQMLVLALVSVLVGAVCDCAWSPRLISSRAVEIRLVLVTSCLTGSLIAWGCVIAQPFDEWQELRFIPGRRPCRSRPTGR